MGSFASPDHALEAFLADHPVAASLPRGNYVEMKTAEGTVHFGGSATFDTSTEGPQQLFAVLVEVVSIDGGWTVKSWATTGC